MTHLPHSKARFFAVAVAFEAALLVAACLVGWLMTPPAWNALQWTWEAALLGLLWALPLLAVLVFMRQLSTGSVGRLNQTVDRHLVPLFEGLGWWHFAVISALAGLGEELLFRGVVQQVLENWTGVITAITLTSVIFGLAHLITPLYAILAAAVSAYLGWLFVHYDRNLVVPTVAHAAYDFVALLYLTRKTSFPASS